MPIKKAATLLDIYDGDDLVKKNVPVKEGQWSVPLESLVPGLHGFTARAGEIGSEQWDVGIYPTLESTDFQDRTWGGWKLTSPSEWYRIGASGENVYGSIAIPVKYVQRSYLEKTLVGLVEGQWYSFKVNVHYVFAGHSLKVHLQANTTTFADNALSNQWKVIEGVFRATQAEYRFVISFSISVSFPPLVSVVNVNIDDIQIAVALPPEDA